MRTIPAILKESADGKKETEMAEKIGKSAIVQEISSLEICCHTRQFRDSGRVFHWHDKYEICQVRRKSCTFRIDGEEVTASEGELVTIGEGIVHQFLIGTEGAEVRIVQFPMRMLLELNKDLKPLKTYISREELQKVPEAAEKIEQLLEMMEQEENLKIGQSNAFLQSLTAALYFLLQRHFEAPKNILSDNRGRQEFYQVAEYVNRHFREEMTVESISAALFLSRGRIAALFKKYAGVGVQEYLHALRVNHANVLLRGGASVTEAALESGFPSVRTFNYIYRKQMQITPSEYRSRFREKDSEEL